MYAYMMIRIYIFTKYFSNSKKLVYIMHFSDVKSKIFLKNPRKYEKI